MELEEYMTRHINEFRHYLGLHKLWTDQSLTAAAGLHARYLARKGELSHDGPGGSPLDRVKECGYIADIIAENVAMSSDISGPGAVFRGWVVSARHKANMLIKDAEDMGVAVATMDGVDYWVALFGARQKHYRLRRKK